MGDGLCWCASDSKCPHGISAKIPQCWDDMEKIIDDVLCQFDRKTIKKFLKRDVDGNAKSSFNDNMKDAYKSEGLQTHLEKLGVKKGGEEPIRSKTASAEKKRLRPSSPNMLSKSMPINSNQLDINSHPEIGESLDDTSTLPSHSNTGTLFNKAKSAPKLPAGSGFSRDMLSGSLPKIPPRANSSHGTSSNSKDNDRSTSPTTHHVPTIAPPIKPTAAWGPTSPSPVVVSSSSGPNLESLDSIKASMQVSSANIELPGETTISVGLQRIADSLARRVLPWQAVLCPKAVESLHDLRQTVIQAKHNNFINSMKQKLEQKVMGFIQKKEEEVEIWIDREIKSWNAFMENDETDLTSFVKADLARITNKAVAQDHAYRMRELVIASTIDDHERDSTREQLINFRRIVRSDGSSGGVAGAGKYASIEVRALQDSIAKAQSVAHKQISKSNRDLARRIEESHDWLCSLADNAITASESEEMLKAQYVALDQEKIHALESLHVAMNTYKDQHNAILEAIVVFAGRIHQHAADYLQREQLISRAFLTYLLNIVNGEIKTHSSDQKKNSYAWETKSLADRGHRKESALIHEFNLNISPLDKMVSDFKERMRIQLDHITLKLQSVMNGRENDVNARKAVIHKKLAKHVNKACNARRQRLKDATQMRRDEFNNEEKCISSVNELCSDLRSAIDQIWVKEHLKERRMYEASTGRMERLEKSALIIWNKHSHLAIGSKEEYEDWLDMSRKDRDIKMEEHLVMIERSWMDWRAAFGEDVKVLGRSVRAPVRALIHDAFQYDVSVSVERNIEDLTQQSAFILDTTMGSIEGLRRLVNNYISDELRKMDQFTEERKSALLQEWRDYLSILNSAVNRRVGGLKDMEADLEETIRLTILQHEVENSVFEQTSCAKMETFWLEWRSKMFTVAKALKENQEDYQIAKQAGKSKSRSSKKDRALDDLVALSKEETSGKEGLQPLPPIGSPVKQLINTDTPDIDTNVYMDDFVDLENTVSDTVRLKRILDEIRPEIYREFTHKITRGLEKVRRDLGEGKKRLVPAYSIARAMLMACDVFWDKAKLAERCVGRISSKGMLLFANGLPTHARSLFCVSSTLYTFSLLTLKEQKIDCDDAFELFENIKQVFLIGLLTVSLQLGEFGEYFLRSEALWACSALGVEPPKELIQMSDSKGIDREFAEQLHPHGFYSEDPVDLLNCIISLPVDLNEVSELQRQYAQMEADAAARAQRFHESSLHEGGSVVDDMSVHSHNQQLVPSGFNLEADSVITDDNIVMGYTNNNVQDFEDLVTRVPLGKAIAKMAYLVPTTDITVYVAMLGRPEGSMEMTPHRLCQVVSLWRRTALAVVTAAYDPPSSEYPRINDLIVAHSAQMSGKRRMGSGNISCISPFEAVSNAIDWVTCIKGIPLSVNQALCLLSRGGSCDPWMEDPKQTGRAGRIIYELNEMLDLMSCPIPRSMIHNEHIQVAFQPNLFEVLKKLDLNYNGQIPVEILRNYIQREDVELTNTQISIIFWTLCRVNDDVASEAGSVAGGSTKTFQTGGNIFKPIVQTEFNADPETYMTQFSEDVTRYLESMPSIDTNVIMGCLSQVLVPASAHELVSDAMKLDISARNAMPTTCCVWLGQRVLSSSEALAALTVKGVPSKSGSLLVGVGAESFNGRGKTDKFFVDIRAHVEVDLLTKYPEMCEIRASDRHYGPAGNDPIKGHEDHWKELTTRRLGRMDRLTLSWRDTMLNEWSTSLYQSRMQRYLKRIEIVKQCVGVYHKQYASLKESIVTERNGLMSRFAAIQSELLALIQQDYNFFAFHASYLERAFRRYEGQFERSVAILTDILSQYQRHCGTIKRRAIARIAAGSDRLQEELEMSCTGMILGYTTGYAQGYFDDLIYRGEVWRNILTDIQGKLIVEKESFMTAKDEIDRDITIQVTDRITLDRNRTKGFLEALSEDTSSILDTVATTRAQYASLQKDANARLILRIEKAVRESRKLRVAAEEQPELEGPVMRDIRVVLDTAYTSCVAIVEQIKDTCLKQLSTVTPLRRPHELKMEQRVRVLEKNWTEMESVLDPMIADYEREVFKQLGLSKSKCLEMIGIYNETETKALKDKHHFDRKGLINAFRKHFREYDLCEAAIFERFNKEVDDTVAEMNKLWGPSRPKFITQGLGELNHIVEDSLVSASNDVISNMALSTTVNDDTTLSRMEVADVFTHSLTQCYQFAQAIPPQFIAEKKHQLVYIEEMSLAKNGDMVRPQVKAVMDLLISGIEIDSDFGKGYDALVKSTTVKTRECYSELSEFVSRYTEAVNPLSIPASAALTRGRITRRKEEVDALLDAARTHIIADNSRLDVLIGAGEKDIEEWTSLTLQLVENAFHNAELSYLSNLWPTPPATPRLELVPEDEDRVGKLKALLKLNDVDTRAVGAMTNPTYEDDFEQAEAERRAKKAQKKADKERRKIDRAMALTNDDHLLTAPAHVKPDETRELQQGWFECCSPEGYTYYFNPATDESLWELPQALKVPLYPDDDEVSVDRLMITPREFLMDSTENMSPPPVNLMRVVPADFTLKVTVDPKVVMGYVAEEARSIALFAMETALDVSAVIRGKKGTDEKTIATLLGDKLNPELLEGYHKAEETLDDPQHHMYDDDDNSVNSGVQLTKYGRLISDTSSRVDSDMQEMLLEIGMGSETGTTAPSLPAIQEELKLVGSYQLNNKEKDRWASLGLGPIEDEHPMVESSDDEGGNSPNNAMNQREKSKKLAEERFAMAKELAKMATEEELSIHYENKIEDTNCKKFMASFAAVLQADTATPYERDCLKELAEVIKPVNVVTILQGLHTSWAKLDAIIADTQAKERAKIAMAEELRTQEGIKRHQTILEHAEDIEEMADFLHTAGLSVTTAKRVATDAICKQISTPKKFAKIWNRQHVTLEEFGIDNDDIEELEIALKKLLMNTTAGSENNMSFSSNYFPAQQQQIGYSPYNSTSNLPTTNSFYLDPAMVTEVSDDYVEEDSPNAPNKSVSFMNSPQQSHHQHHQSQHSMASSKSSQRLVKKYSMKNGYKSFKGGWIVGYSEDNHKYYYNTFTGASSWHLPEEGLSTEDDHELEHVEEEGDEAVHEDHQHWELPGHHTDIHAPTSDFVHTYVDPYANNELYPYDHNQYNHEEHPQQQQYHQDHYQEGYDPSHHYDENGYPVEYDAAHTGGEYDHNYYGGDGHSAQPYQYYDESGQLVTYDPSQYGTEYDPNNQQYEGEDGYYNDDTQQNHQHSDYDLSDFRIPPKPRTLPVPVKLEVGAYAKKEGVARQLELLNAQDRWQNSLVKSQHFITEQKSLYLDKRVEMFDKVSERVNQRLDAFVEDIKYMQKTIKKELGESNSTERDLRRLFDESHGNVIQAEKLSFVLESLEKFKHTLSLRYDSAFKQISKFASDWELIRQELNQVGDIYDEGIAANLDQCRLSCEHNAKVFAYDQLKAAAATKKAEMKLLRRSMHHVLLGDTRLIQESREVQRQQHLQYYRERELQRERVKRDMGGKGWSKTIEAEVVASGFPPLDPVVEVGPEEDFVMSYMLTQLEMEASLSSDYDSITEASKNMALDLQNGIRDFDLVEKKNLIEEGSWFNKHRETLERHEAALNVTLTKVRNRVNEGYRVLQAKVEALDFEVERAAEEELFQASVDDE